jgi:hypothetical protein
MSDKLIALDVAEFLDSPQAARLGALTREERRRLCEPLVAACYQDLGKRPNLLDGHDVEVLLRDLLPGRLAPREPLIERAPALLEAFFAHLREAQVLLHAYEIDRALEAGLPAFVAHVRTGRNASAQLATPQKPVVYGAPKLGRNEPCSCGSGKKYKKCHGAGS